MKTLFTTMTMMPRRDEHTAFTASATEGVLGCWNMDVQQEKFATSGTVSRPTILDVASFPWFWYYFPFGVCVFVIFVFVLFSFIFYLGRKRGYFFLFFLCRREDRTDVLYFFSGFVFFLKIVDERERNSKLFFSLSLLHVLVLLSLHESLHSCLFGARWASLL